MKLKELLNTCQNTYMGKLFQNNPLFTATLNFEEKSENLLEGDYVLKANYCDDERYLDKYRNREVLYWYALGRNDLYICIEGRY